MNPTVVTEWATVALATVAIISIIANISLVVAAKRQAIETSRLAEETAKIIEQNSELVRAAVRQAEAGEAEARAVERQAELSAQEVSAVSEQTMASVALVEETRTDRGLAYRPYLAVSLDPVSEGGHRVTVDRYFVRNLGRGPALNWRMAHHDFSGTPREHHFWATQLFDLGPGAALKIEPSTGTWYYNVLNGLQYDTVTVDACCCEDQFGNKFRFARGHEMGRNPQDEWHAGEPEPGWTGWYMALP